MSSVKKSKTGTASGVNESTSRLSGMLSVALLGALAISFFGHNLGNWMHEHPVRQHVRQRVINQKDKLAKIDIPKKTSKKVKMNLKKGIHHAFLKSFKMVMMIASAISIATAIAVWFIIEPGIKEFREVERE